MSGKTPAQVLELALRTSAFAFAGLINGDVVTIFGVAPRSMITGSGVPWLVGSDLLERYQSHFPPPVPASSASFPAALSGAGKLRRRTQHRG